jgi:hypothetical protein
MTARPIGLDGAPVSLLDEILIRGCMQDLARKFMTQNPRISIGRMGPTIGMKIAPTNTDAPHPEEGIAGFWGGLRNLTLDEFTWSLQNDLSHAVLSVKASLLEPYN